MDDRDDFEVELKLDVDPGQLDALAAAPLFADAQLRAVEQVSTYHDTPRHELRAAGLSLRVRKGDGRWLQTVKADGAATAGLFARPEWEREVAGEQPVLDDAAGPLAAMMPREVLEAIVPMFRSEVTRRSGLVEHAEGQIEIAIDSGRIVSGDAEEPVAEVELELKRGDAGAVFAIARALDDIAAVRLGVLTKAERGYRLTAKDRKSIKAEPSPLVAGMTAGQAFGAIAGTCLRHFRLNEAILQRNPTPDALHQARVALRRLRSALSIFRRVVADDRLPYLRGELRWLAGVLGDARDIDVLLARKPGQDGDILTAARERAYAAVTKALASRRARALMIDISEWLAIGGWLADPAQAKLRDRPVEQFAADALDRLRRRVKRKGRGLAGLDDEHRHEVRISAKKLRYAAEFFVPLFVRGKAARRADAFLTTLEDLQEHLGDLNDIAHGPSVLARLGIAAAPDAGMRARREQLLDQAERAHEALVDRKRFWR